MLISLKDVGKSYLTTDIETRALRDIDISIDRGEYVAIEGPSGCGKSTLLSIIGLLDQPTSGSYHLNGTMVSGLNAFERATIRNREIGFIFQSFNLIGDLSVQENVELPLIYRGMTRKERHLRASDVLQRVHIGHRAKHYPSQLSGGEQQRVAVARALAGDPLMLLADEPTGNLDTRNGEDVMQIMNELHSAGATIVMVTHDHRFAKYAMRSIRLVDGQLASEVPLADADPALR